jgi:hypothetical protein
MDKIVTALRYRSALHDKGKEAEMSLFLIKHHALNMYLEVKVCIPNLGTRFKLYPWDREWCPWKGEWVNRRPRLFPLPTSIGGAAWRFCYEYCLDGIHSSK